MQDKGNTAFLDILRWSATIDVILYHILNAAVSYVEIDRGGVMGFNLIAIPMRWHVPMFLMISGALFLNPNKEISIKKLYSKNIKRLVLALALFGYAFALLEIYFNTRSINAHMFIEGIYNLITGNTWSHLWYLYMLIGIYMLVPPIKAYCDSASKRIKTYTIIVLFVFLSVLYEIAEVWSIKIGFSIPLAGSTLLYFLLGQYCMYELESNKRNRLISLVGIIGALLIIGLNGVLDLGLNLSVSSPALVVLTISLFVFAKEMNLHSNLLTQTKHLCFGMYLVHMVFINIAYKLMHISPFDYPLVLSVPIFGACVIVLSLLCSYIMNLIPALRKYVL